MGIFTIHAHHRMHDRFQRQRHGFTLIELLVVVAIIGILATIATFSTQQAALNARSTRRLADLKQLQKVVEQYNSDNGAYPSTSGVWRYDCYPTMNYYDNYIPNVVGSYIGKLPHDPSGKCSGVTTELMYLYRSNGTDYKLLIPYTQGTFEDCAFGAEHGVKDPIRTCTTSGKGWAIYSNGGVNF